MARFAISAVVGVAVGIFATPAAGFQAFALTYGATGFLDPNQKVQGPRLDDLKAPTASPGTPIPYIFGAWRTAGTFAWTSEKREIATTEEVGGKGGPNTDSTTYTYEIDALYILSANEIAGVRRIWSNGELVWSIADDADSETRRASGGLGETVDSSAVIITGQTDHWRGLRVYSGAVTQLPDPTYEAAVGVGNAPAYRGRGSIFIEGLQLLGGGQLPVLTFEVASRIGPSDVVLQTEFADASSEDISPAQLGPGTRTGGDLQDGTYTVIPTEPTNRGIVWTNQLLQCLDGDELTVEFLFTARSLSIPVSNASVEIFRYVAGFGSGNYVFAINGRIDGGNPASSAFTYKDPTGGSQNWEDNKTALDSRLIHAAIVFDRVSPSEVRVYVDGQLVESNATQSEAVSGDGNVHLASNAQFATVDYEITYHGVRVTRAQRYTGTSFSPPDTFFNPVGIAYADPEPLNEVVSALCLRTGLLEASDIDVTELASDTVEGYAVSQIGSTRAALQPLLMANLVDTVEAQTIRFVKRGGAIAMTVPYTDLGATTGEPVEPLPLRRLNDIELPAQFGVKFSNFDNDYQDGFEYGDRLVSSSTAVTLIESPIAMTPTKAKRMADVATMDAQVGLLSIGPVSMTQEYAAVEPTDVLALTGPTGSLYRARILKKVESDRLLTFEATLDDATVINSVAQGSGNYTSSTIVRALAETQLELLDIPLLRDADDTPGIYAAAGAISGSKWPGCRLYSSPDAVSYTKAVDFTERATIGSTTTVLGDWAGGNVLDETNGVTVTVNAALSSYTKANILGGLAPLYLAGDELFYARTATLVSEGVYTLSGLLRAQRGTASTGHEAAERFVVIRQQGLRTVEHQLSEIGLNRTYKAVTFGKSLDSATAESLIDTGIRLKPFAGVNLRVARGASDINISWRRRSRLSSRFLAEGIDAPLGEVTESYVIELWDAGYLNLIRTLTSTTNSVTYTAAQQTEDSHTLADPIYARVYQLSASIGRGFVLETTA